MSSSLGSVGCRWSEEQVSVKLALGNSAQVFCCCCWKTHQGRSAQQDCTTATHHWCWFLHFFKITGSEVSDKMLSLSCKFFTFFFNILYSEERTCPHVLQRQSLVSINTMVCQCCAALLTGFMCIMSGLWHEVLSVCTDHQPKREH